MNKQRSASLLGLALAASHAVAACGSDSEGADSTDAPADSTAGTTATDGTTAPDGTTATDGTAASGEAVSLAGDCPETVVIQTDWMPEAEHGFLYQMVGEGYEIDAGKAYVTGPLIDAGGNDTGVKIQVRSGGAAQNFSPVTQIMYADDAVTLGYVYTDEAIQFSGDFPTVAIESGFEKNPQMIMWDPATYPDVKSIEDLGKTDAKVRYFDGAAYMDYFVQAGILQASQVDGSYSGDSTLFIADEGKAAQQGFGSAEPYNYEHEIKGWMKPVKYQYINDVGWKNYAESIATKPENIEKYKDCLAALVPIIQQASIDYVNDPERANGVILAAVDAFGEDFGWTYSEGAAAFGVATMLEDGLIAKAIPTYGALGQEVDPELTAEDVVTNQFIDESIGF
jgi:hypothetical protein